MRSSWKIPVIDERWFSKKNLEEENSKIIRRINRASFIQPIMVGRFVEYHIGNVPYSLQIKNSMLFYKFGEFCFNKKMSIRIHLKNEKSKNKKANRK